MLDKVIHPVTGEEGFFVTPVQKKAIDVVINDFKHHYFSEDGGDDSE